MQGDTRSWRTVAPFVLAALAAMPACRRGEALPEVAGARTVIPLSAVLLFRDAPVSTREFESAERRYDKPSSPRFDEGWLRTRPDFDGGMIQVESPPKMAFQNRGNDCGSASDRRICALPWDQAEMTLCGRPFNGHVELANERLADAGLLFCRVIEPAHETADGDWEYASRDCTQGRRIPLRTLHPQDFTFRVGDVALVADPGGAYDRTVCEKVSAILDRPVHGAAGAQEAGQP